MGGKHFGGTAGWGTQTNFRGAQEPPECVFQQRAAVSRFSKGSKTPRWLRTTLGQSGHQKVQGLDFSCLSLFRPQASSLVSLPAQ